MSTAFSLPDDEHDCNDPEGRSDGFADDAPSESPIEDPQDDDGRPTAVEPPPSSEPAQAPPDPFDPARLRIDQDFAAKSGIVKILTTIAVRRPSKEVFVRTHPDATFRLQTGVIEMKDDRETFLADPGLWPMLAGEATFTPKLLVLTVTRAGVPFLWPIRLPGPDGRIDDWNRSALEAADAARHTWVRVVANQHLGAYDVLASSGIVAQPEFPDLTMGQVLKIAFKDRFIDSPDHPTLRRLRGEL
jgi:hypothetical protein